MILVAPRSVNTGSNRERGWAGGKKMKDRMIHTTLLEGEAQLGETNLDL